MNICFLNIRRLVCQARGRILLLACLASPLLAACQAVSGPVPPQDLCQARKAPDESLRIVATTGQIGNTVRMIAGLDPLAPGLWSQAEIEARTGWLSASATDAQADAIASVALPITVETMLGPGTDPHLYIPTLGDVEQLRGADIIFYNGLHLEAQMLNALQALAAERCVIALGDILYADEQFHDLILHNAESAVDPHIWNSPELWAGAIDIMVRILDDMYAGTQPALEANAQLIQARLAQAQALIPEMFRDDAVPVKYLVTAHDAFGYYTRLAGLKSIGLQGLSTETEVSAHDIQAIVDTIVEKQIPAIFVESSVSEDAVQAVQAAARARGWDVVLGGELYSDALGPAGTEGSTYLGMLQHNTITIFQALAGRVNSE